MNESYTMEDLYTMVDERLSELRIIAWDNWKVNPDFDISYELNSANKIWVMSVKDNQITMLLNPNLLKEFTHDYIQEVVSHEFAHIVIYCLYPSGYNKYNNKVQPHGKEFKAVCSWFWVSWKSTTSLFTNSEHLQSKNTRNHKYSCGCMEHMFSTRRHNLVQRDNKKYRCRICGNSIEYMG